MRNLLAATVLAIVALDPAIGSACDYGDETSASTAPPEQVASTPAPQATKAPVAKVAKGTPNAVKPVASKTKPSVSDEKVAAAPSN